MSRFSELKAAGTDWVRFSNSPTPRVLEAGLRGRSQVAPQGELSLDKSGDSEAQVAARTEKPSSVWTATIGIFAAVAAWIVASYWLPQGPLGWLLGWKAPTATESACVGILKSPLCYFSDQTVKQLTPKKTWVVVDIRLADGSTGSMAFDNRPGTDISVDACRSALPAIAGVLKERVGEALKTTAFTIAGMKCVESPNDPLIDRAQK